MLICKQPAKPVGCTRNVPATTSYQVRKSVLAAASCCWLLICRCLHIRSLNTNSNTKQTRNSNSVFSRKARCVCSKVWLKMNDSLIDLARTTCANHDMQWLHQGIGGAAYWYVCVPTYTCVECMHAQTVTHSCKAPLYVYMVTLCHVSVCCTCSFTAASRC